jgi:hypothetical protein
MGKRIALIKRYVQSVIYNRYTRSICNHVGLDSAFLVAGLVIKINYYWGHLTPINAILFPILLFYL